MPVIWNLKKWLAVERDIYRPSELQAVLAQNAGVQLSLQAISALINGKPNALRLQTIQALCNALDCKLSDFCEVLPDTPKERQRRRKVAGVFTAVSGVRKINVGDSFRAQTECESQRAI